MNTSNTSQAVVVDQLVKTYPDGTAAVRGISFAVEAGEMIGVVGPNGAGKSTTLNIVGTLLSPTSGSVKIFGVSVNGKQAVQPYLGVALQTAGLDPLMRIEDHFSVHAALYGMSSRIERSRTQELADYFQLGPVWHQSAGTLSGGMQRRTSLALALMHEPQVLVFDEPTVGLDPNAKRAVWDLLEHQRERGLAIIVSTHDMNEAEHLCQRIELLSKGQVVASGTPDELKTRLGRGVLQIRTTAAETVADSILDAVERGALPASLELAVKGDHIRVETKTRDLSFVELVFDIMSDANATIIELSWGYHSLDDVFIQLAESSSQDEPSFSATMEHTALARRKGHRR